MLREDTAVPATQRRSVILRRVFHTVSQHKECILQVSIANKTLSDAHKFKVKCRVLAWCHV